MKKPNFRFGFSFRGAGGNAENGVTGSLLISMSWFIALLTERSPDGH